VRTPELTGLLWMVSASLLFAIMSITARLASRSASWTTIAASRAGVGALVAFAFALRSGVSMKTRSVKLSWARSILGTLAMLSCFYSLAQSSLAVGDAVTLFATAPLFIALMAPWVLKERSDARLWALLLVAFAGVGLVAGPHLSLLSKGAAFPALAALGSAFFSALAMMFLRVMRSGRGSVAQESAEAIALHFALVSFVVHAILGCFDFRAPAPIDLLLLAITGLSGGLAQLAMTKAYAYVEASRLGAVSYLGTVLSFVLAILFLGERPEVAQLAGAGLVVGAGVVLALSAARAAPRSSPA